MTETKFKPVVRYVLRQMGLAVSDIPRSSDKTPDFKVTEARDVYLVELKIKADDPTELEEDRKILTAGRVLAKSKPLSRRNKLDQIIRKCCEQFADYDAKNQKLHIPWLHCDGLDAALHYERFRATLFGTQKLISSGVPNVLECYYFHNSAFFRHRDLLDAAIVSHEDIRDPGLALQLCVNSLGSRIARLRRTQLYQQLGEGRCDPDELAARNLGMIADASCPRDSESNTLTYLRTKYQLDHLQTITLAQHTAAIGVKNRFAADHAGSAQV
jgi:hypothetical protein